MDLRKPTNMLLEKLRQVPWAQTGYRHVDRVAIVFASYNTRQLTSYLLFSLFRTLGREQIATIVAVDNNSTDGSRELLENCAQEGLIEVILNKQQRYHGFALNQAINHLARQVKESRSNRTLRSDFDYIWVIDSDVIVLRPDVLTDAIKHIRHTNAALIGEFQYDALPEGYAHVSSLLIDPRQVWQRGIAPFDNSGAPAKEMHLSLRKQGRLIEDFPFRTHNYILHMARGTLKSIIEKDDKDNIYYQWAADHCEHHFHGNANGQGILDEFKNLYAKEIGDKNTRNTVDCYKTILDR